MVDLAVQVALVTAAWMIAVAAMLPLSFILGWYVVVVPLVAVFVVPLVGVIVNEVVLPRQRGWTVGMLAAGLRLPRSPVRLGSLLLRSAVTWLPIALPVIVLVGSGGEMLWIGERVAYAVLAWGLVLSVPWQGRSLLDRVAGWQPTRRTRRLLDVPARSGSGLDLLAALVAGVVGVGVLVVVVVVVIAVVNNPGRPVDQAETELRNAAAAMERFHEEHGHYDTAALDPWTWGYRPEHVDVWIEPHIPPDGHTYCLEGLHADVHPPIASFDPVRGFAPDSTC